MSLAAVVGNCNFLIYVQYMCGVYFNHVCTEKNEGRISLTYSQE